MASRTFTVLVTVTDDRVPDALAIERHIDQALHEGTRDFKGVSAAFVDAFDGDKLPSVIKVSERDVEKAKRAHREIAASWAAEDAPSTAAKLAAIREQEKRETPEEQARAQRVSDAMVAADSAMKAQDAVAKAQVTSSPNKTIGISPRYTDYKSRAALLLALTAGKDFTVADMSSPWDGKACNLADLRAAGITTVRARYDRLTKQTTIDISKNIE